MELEIPPVPAGHAKNKFVSNDGTPHPNEVLAVWADEVYADKVTAKYALRKLGKQGQRNIANDAAEQARKNKMSRLRLTIKSKDRMLAGIYKELGVRGYQWTPTWTPTDEAGSPACLSSLADELAAQVQARAYAYRQVEKDQAKILEDPHSSVEKIGSEKILAEFLSASAITSQLADYGVEKVEEMQYLDDDHVIELGKCLKIVKQKIFISAMSTYTGRSFKIAGR